MRAEQIINLERYPIHTPGSRLDGVLSQVREQLAFDGCSVLKNFLTPAGIEYLCAEADGVSDKGHRHDPVAFERARGLYRGSAVGRCYGR